MPILRTLSLTLGPLLIVAACWWLTMTDAGGGLAATAAPFVASDGIPDGSGDALQDACRQRADALAPRLSGDCRLIVRAPYVLGGDLTEAQLAACYENVVVPVARALWTAHFDRRPDEPVVVLMFSGEDSYREHARRLDGRRTDAYYGYYQRSDRRVVMNAATGYGTLAHELTHALAHFDFPKMPEWFDEGLASLYEESEFIDEGLRLVGVHNWRLHGLLQALRQDRLPPLESLVSAGANREAVDYAQARYLCFYLQQRGLLEPFYRKFRASVDGDPTGARTLCELLQADSLAQVDRDFRRWLGEIRDAATPE